MHQKQLDQDDIDNKIEAMRKQKIEQEENKAAQQKKLNAKMKMNSNIGVSALKGINPKSEFTFKDNGEAMSVKQVKAESLPKQQTHIKFNVGQQQSVFMKSGMTVASKENNKLTGGITLKDVENQYGKHKNQKNQSDPNQGTHNHIQLQSGVTMTIGNNRALQCNMPTAQQQFKRLTLAEYRALRQNQSHNYYQTSRIPQLNFSNPISRQQSDVQTDSQLPSLPRKDSQQSLYQNIVEEDNNDKTFNKGNGFLSQKNPSGTIYSIGNSSKLMHNQVHRTGSSDWLIDHSKPIKATSSQFTSFIPTKQTQMGFQRHMTDTETNRSFEKMKQFNLQYMSGRSSNGMSKPTKSNHFNSRIVVNSKTDAIGSPVKVSGKRVRK